MCVHMLVCLCAHACMCTIAFVTGREQHVSGLARGNLLWVWWGPGGGWAAGVCGAGIWWGVGRVPALTFPLRILAPTLTFQASSLRALLGVWGHSHHTRKFHPYVSDSFTLIKMWFFKSNVRCNKLSRFFLLLCFSAKGCGQRPLAKRKRIWMAGSWTTEAGTPVRLK